MRTAARSIGAATLALSLALAGIAVAQSGDRAPGERFAIDINKLPAPYSSPSAVNPAERVPRPATATLRVPAGFRATLFADNLDHPRTILVAPNGDVLIAESQTGSVTLLRDADADGRADLKSTLVEGLNRPFGLAIQPDGLYIADVAGVWRVDYAPGDLKPRGRPARITPAGALGPASGHWTRNLAFHPDGRSFYVSVGSAGNIAEEPSPRATIQQFNRDGSGQRTLAGGLRNAIGIAIRPGTADLWAVVNERDGLGDDLVPDYLGKIEPGSFHGWPYAWLGARPQPGLGAKRPDLVAATRVPELLFEAHSAPIHMAFYDKTLFPERYRGGAFVALQGSWNADKPRGYFVAFVPFGADGKPAGGYEVFASGFWIAGASRATIWGKPAGVAVAPDGALFMSDDVGRTIWRIVPSGR